jgi:hypothetical protein
VVVPYKERNDWALWILPLFAVGVKALPAEVWTQMKEILRFICKVRCDCGGPCTNHLHLGPAAGTSMLQLLSKIVMLTIVVILRCC